MQLSGTAGPGIPGISVDAALEGGASILAVNEYENPANEPCAATGYGVYAEAKVPQCGSQGNAGVHGSYSGFHDGGVGVIGVTTNATSKGSVGVAGYSLSDKGSGVYAWAGGPTTAALEARHDMSGGAAIRVDGGISVKGTSRPAFVHTTSPLNIAGNGTVIDNPLSNGKKDALLFVTHNYNKGESGGSYANFAIGVFYSAVDNKWQIYREDNAAMPQNLHFNVLIVNSEP